MAFVERLRAEGQEISVDNTVNIPYNEEIDFYSNILSTDADFNSTKKIMVFDRTDRDWSGDLLFNGVPLAAKTWHTIDIGDVNDLKFRSGTRTFDEQVLVKVYDGMFWSAAGKVVFETVPRPEVASDRVVFGQHLARIDMVDPGEVLYKNV